VHLFNAAEEHAWTLHWVLATLLCKVYLSVAMLLRIDVNVGSTRRQRLATLRSTIIFKLLTQDLRQLLFIIILVCCPEDGVRVDVPHLFCRNWRHLKHLVSVNRTKPFCVASISLVFPLGRLPDLMHLLLFPLACRLGRGSLAMVFGGVVEERLQLLG